MEIMEILKTLDISTIIHIFLVMSSSKKIICKLSLSYNFNLIPYII